MATQDTAPATPAAAAAPHPAEAAPNNQTPVTTDDSLSKALAARAEQLSSGKPAKVEEPPAETKEEPAADEGEAKPDAVTEAKPKDKPAEAERPAEPAMAESPKDAVADELAKIARASQAASHRQRELDTRESAIKAKQDAIAKAEALEAAAKADPLKAIELLLGPDALAGDLAFKLIDAAVARQQGKPEPTKEEQEAALIAKAKAEAIQELEAKQAEASKRQEEERQARAEANKASYFSQLAAYTKANASKYQLVASQGVDVDEVEKFIDARHAATGKLATADEVLGHFEKQLEERAEHLHALLTKKRGPAAAAGAATVPAAAAVKPAVDTRGKAPTPKKVTSFEEDREARMAALNR